MQIDSFRTKDETLRLPFNRDHNSFPFLINTTFVELKENQEFSSSLTRNKKWKLKDYLFNKCGITTTAKTEESGI